MINWHPEVKELLDNQNYQALVNYYEQLLENERDEISNYYYLGLACLLNEEEEEAQLTWLLPLSQEANINQLGFILKQEAERQEDIKNYPKTWVIRLAIKEIYPKNLENLLSLLCLSIDLNLFDSSYLTEWGVMEILRTDDTQSVNVNLLEKVVEKILNIPHKYHLKLAELILVYADFNDRILNGIKEVAKHMIFENVSIDYGIELLKICFNFKPDRVFLINLYSAYCTNNQYEEAISILNRAID